MIKPIHIFLLMMLSGVFVHFNRSYFFILNELFQSSLIVGLVLFGLRKHFDKVNFLSVIALIFMNLANLVSLAFNIRPHDPYMVAYTIVGIPFFGFILYVRLNERITK